MNKIHVQMTKDGSHTLMSSLFDDSYHAHNGAISESEHVYIQSGLADLDPSFERVNILELGFGSGMNAMLTLKRTDPIAFLEDVVVELTNSQNDKSTADVSIQVGAIE